MLVDAGVCFYTHFHSCSLGRLINVNYILRCDFGESIPFMTYIIIAKLNLDFKSQIISAYQAASEQTAKMTLTKF
jgi:hypothetical protein